MSSTEVRALYGIVRVSRKPDRYRVVEHATGQTVGFDTTKGRADMEARGRNRMAAQGGWCAQMRYESGRAVLCGDHVPAYGVCPRADQHVNRKEAR
jgi:hypothetical protein